MTDLSAMERYSFFGFAMFWSAGEDFTHSDACLGMILLLGAGWRASTHLSALQDKISPIQTLAGGLQLI